MIVIADPEKLLTDEEFLFPYEANKPLNLLWGPLLKRGYSSFSAKGDTKNSQPQMLICLRPYKRLVKTGLLLKFLVVNSPP